MTSTSRFAKLWVSLTTFAVDKMGTLSNILASYGGRQPTPDEDVILNALGGHQPSRIVPPTTYKPLGVVWTNIADEYTNGGLPCMFIDHSKAGTGYTAKDGGTITLNADGYPQACSTRAYTLVPVDGTNAKSGSDQTMVIDVADTGLGVGIAGATGTPSNTIVNGRRRIEFAYSLYGDGNFLEIAFTNITPTSFARPAAGQPAPFRMFLKSEEARQTAGNLMRQHFVDSHVDYDGLRPMSISHVIGSGGQISSHAQATKITNAQWHSVASGDTIGVPLAVQCRMANECNTHLWVNVPAAYTDQAAIDYATELCGTLAPNLRARVEHGNEASWNYGFPFSIGSITFEQMYDPKAAPNAEGYNQTGNYGYRATQLLAAMVKSQNYTDRLLPFFGTQNLADNVSRGIFAGSDVAIAEWANPNATPRPYRLYNQTTQKFDVLGTSGGYQPDLAAHFTKTSDLIKGMGGAPYELGNISDGLSDADKATIRAWPNDPNGFLKLANLIIHGTGLSVKQPCLDDLPARYAAQKAAISARGIPMVAYELQLSSDQEIGISAWLYQFFASPLCTQVIRDYYGPALIAAGFTQWAVLADSFGLTYGSMKGAFDLDAARRQGWLATKSGVGQGATVPPVPTPPQATYPTPRYYRFTVAGSIYQDRVGCAELRFNNATGPVAPTGFTATASLDSGGNGPDRLVDGLTNISFITQGNGAGCVIIIDVKNAIKFASVDVFACAEVGGFSFKGVTVESSVDQTTWNKIGSTTYSDYGGSWNIPLSFVIPAS